jgi:hypothetical protein
MKQIMFWDIAVLLALYYQIYFYFPIYVVYMRKYYDGKKICIEILNDLYVLNLPEYEEVIFGVLSLCMHLHFSSAWRVGWILFIFDIQEFICYRVMHGAYKRFSSKNRSPSDGPQGTKWQFSWKWLKWFWLSLSNLWRPSSVKY